MTTVSVNTYTHSVTYVADNMLKSLKDIIRLSGLDPANFIEDWEVNKRGIKCWLETQYLIGVELEIYDPKTDALLFRWDMDVVYGWSSDDGNFWVDTDQLKYAIRKAGLVPSQAKYSLLLRTKPGRPDVDGWQKSTGRSTAGFTRQSLGTTIDHSGLGANTAYWRKSG
ncbi:HORMA domain containing protein [Maricaulis sp. D1M11]|uniref:HORMA domain containing protein n=1 Tax=Maricaulis sp. D1M11 TaxID=3076117 RepID=UPI0039B51B2D